jgi:hypothetical protein
MDGQSLIWSKKRERIGPVRKGAKKVPKEHGSPKNPLDNRHSNSVLYQCSGRVAQWESTAFTRQGSEVQNLSRLPLEAKEIGMLLQRRTSRFSF